MYNEKIMEMSIRQAEAEMLKNNGGPFGAAVVKDGTVISIAGNTVLADHDPTAHAEMNAIREACRKLETYDLEGCELYATGYPCPMCMSAIIWSNIKTVYVCNDIKLAEEIGFRDDFIYDFIRADCSNDSLLKINMKPIDAGRQLYCKYKEMNKKIY